MKKLLILFVSTALYAAPVGNPSAPSIIQRGFFTSCNDWMDVRAGYEGDFISDGRMKQYNQGTGRVDTYEQWTNSGTLTLNFLERLDLYSVLGSSRAEADWRFSDLALDTINRIEMETEYNFLWGIGGRVILYEWYHASLGCGGRYSSSKTNPAWISSNGVVVNARDSSVHYREWQVNLDVSYHIDLFTPYIGIKYSNARVYLRQFPTPIADSWSGSNSFENRIPVGLYIGCTLSNGQYFMLNVEARLIDEEAVTVSGDFRF